MPDLFIVCCPICDQYVAAYVLASAAASEIGGAVLRAATEGNEIGLTRGPVDVGPCLCPVGDAP
jgi:hypothetical protein